MTNLSNNNGRAYEFAFLNVLCEEISRNSFKVKVERNSSLIAAKNAWDMMDITSQTSLRLSSSVGVNTLFQLEPLILEDKNSEIFLKIQNDVCGKEGDVRDIVIRRNDINWEIGLSIKHNHFAIKHSRLSKKIDFGDKWFGIQCSQQYWDDIKPIFDYLDIEKNTKSKWSELLLKEESIYIPLLQAFIDEIRRSYELHGSKIPKKMVEYLLGTFDFYKVISIVTSRTTRVQAFNLRGTLNQPSSLSKPAEAIEITQLPTRIINIEFKPESKNTINMYFDAGWQFSFRIHNASSNVESSLKFDINIIGMPTTINSIDCSWD